MYVSSYKKLHNNLKLVFYELLRFSIFFMHNFWDKLAPYSNGTHCLLILIYIDVVLSASTHLW